MRTLLALIALTLATLVVFALRPRIDLDVSNAFYGASGFVGNTRLERAARDFFSIAPFVVLAAYTALYAMRRLGIGVPYAPTGRGLSFLVATMLIGPLFVVNLGLKDNTHRPRPVQTKDFGGKFEFRPWYRFDGQCAKNCSFVSGEASEAFWMTAPASLAPPPLRVLTLSLALAFGVATGLLRMAFGGHYLSDVILAGLIMLVIVQGARMWFFSGRDPS